MSKLNDNQINELLTTLSKRFNSNVKRHKDIKWSDVEDKLRKNDKKLYSLYLMEESGGEVDVVGCDNDEYIFYDCSTETPKGRRSLCYDNEALNSRKEYKPKNSAINMAKDMGIEVLSIDEYMYLQTLGNFDLKTSSWITTPKDIRELGGALFGDKRYNHTFIYHNGAESYYASRGFRGLLRV